MGARMARSTLGRGPLIGGNAAPGKQKDRSTPMSLRQGMTTGILGGILLTGSAAWSQEAYQRQAPVEEFIPRDQQTRGTATPRRSQRQANGQRQAGTPVRGSVRPGQFIRASEL